MSGRTDFEKAIAIQDTVKDFAEQLEGTYHTRVITCDEEGYVPGSLMPHDFIRVRLLLSDEQNLAMDTYTQQRSIDTDLVADFPSTSDCTTEWDLGAVYHNFNELYFHTARGAVLNLLSRWNLPPVMATGDEYVTKEERRAQVEEVGRIIREEIAHQDAAVHRWVAELEDKAQVTMRHIDHRRSDGVTRITLEVEVPDVELPLEEIGED